jgi:hypothetical protein
MVLKLAECVGWCVDLHTHGSYFWATNDAFSGWLTGNAQNVRVFVVLWCRVPREPYDSLAAQLKRHCLRTGAERLGLPLSDAKRQSPFGPWANGFQLRAAAGALGASHLRSTEEALAVLGRIEVSRQRKAIGAAEEARRQASLGA